MNSDEIRAVVLKVLGEIAPEALLDEVNPGQPLQDQLDLDSMDFLNFVAGLHQATGIDVPERDYDKIATLDGCIAYLAGHTAGL